MIPKYINDWLTIIENMKNSNTYALAWGRSLIECIYNNMYETENDKAVLQLRDIAHNMLKY